MVYLETRVPAGPCDLVRAGALVAMTSLERARITFDEMIINA